MRAATTGRATSRTAWSVLNPAAASAGAAAARRSSSPDAPLASSIRPRAASATPRPKRYPAVSPGARGSGGSSAIISSHSPNLTSAAYCCVRFQPESPMASSMSTGTVCATLCTAASVSALRPSMAAEKARNE